MDWFLSPSHQSLRATVRDFAEREIRPRIAELEHREGVAEDLSRLVIDQGWLGVTIPSRYGGTGAGHLAKTLIIEELSRVSGAMGAMMQGAHLGVAKVLHFGTEEQRRHWLPQFASGHVIPTIALTEWESGGHFTAMESTAVRDGDEYVLNGHKCFVGNSHLGDVHGVVVRTGPGSKGLSAFLIERDRPGFNPGALGTQAGMHGFSFGEILFEDCRVPVRNRIGEEGEGLNVAFSSSILYGRANLTAVALGVHQAIFEETVRFCQEREQYGRPLAKLQTIAAKVGEMTSRLATARLAAYHAVHLLDQGKACDMELINAKLINTELALTSARVAMEIFAARGVQREFHVERYLRDVLHTFPAAGTSDVQRLRLSEVAFGTNRTPWSERLSEIVRCNPPGALTGLDLAG
jgi:alkylation response protein AidB-like acyl-CoA dehydrogenase